LSALPRTVPSDFYEDTETPPYKIQMHLYKRERKRGVPFSREAIAVVAPWILTHLARCLRLPALKTAFPCPDAVRDSLLNQATTRMNAVARRTQQETADVKRRIRRKPSVTLEELELVNERAAKMEARGITNNKRVRLAHRERVRYNSLSDKEYEYVLERQRLALQRLKAVDPAAHNEEMNAYQRKEYALREIDTSTTGFTGLFSSLLFP
jgi:hypothetical protein